MKHPARMFVSVLLAVFLLTSGTPVLAAESAASDAEPNRLIVYLDKDAPAARVASANERTGARVLDRIPALNAEVVEVSGPTWMSSLVYRLYGDAVRVEVDQVAEIVDVPNDTYYDTTRQWGWFQINTEDAWDVTRSNPEIRIAIVDTGIDSDHPDLDDKIVAAADFTGSGTPEPYSNSHGTHVAGIAAAETDNATGIAGVAWNASLMNAKCMSDSGTGYHSWIANGITWAVDNGADVINMSLGGASGSYALEQAIDYAWENGVVVVAAAGNSGSTSQFYPAAYENCISVAASTSTDELTSWSNHGDWVDVSAPSWAYSTKIGGYTTMQGTSMASPVVAGLAALVLDVSTDENGNGRVNDEARNAIQSTCFDAGTDVRYGRVDAAAAVASRATPIPNAAPVLEPIGDQSTVEGQELQFSIIATDPDEDSLSFSASGLPTGSTFSERVFSWTPSYDQAGSYSVSFSVSDGQLQDSETVTITVADVPLYGDVEGTVSDATTGAPLSGAMVTTGDASAMTDAEGQYLLSSILATEWTIEVHAEGYVSTSGGVVVEPSQTTTADFALDPEAAPNEAPVLDSIGNKTVDAGQSLEFTVSASDPDGDVLTYTTTGLPTGASFDDRTFSWSPSAGQEGTYSVTFTVSDGELAASETISITVRSPEPQPEGVMWTRSIDFTSIEHPTRTLLDVEVKVVTPEPLRGAYVFVDVTTSDGDESHLYTRTDSLGSAEYELRDVRPVTYTVTVTRVQHSEYEWDSSLGVTTRSYSLGDEPETGTVTGTVASSADGVLIAGATVSDGAQTATTDSSGAYTLTGIAVGEITLTASAAGYLEGSKTVLVAADTTATCDLALEPVVNSAPVLDAIGNATVAEGEALEFTISASDADGDALAYMASALPEGAELADQVFSWTPGYDQSGSYDITFTVSDGELTDAETITVTVLDTPLYGSVQGTVTDVSTGGPVAAATIASGGLSALTDSQGRYMLSNVPATTWTIDAYADGYASASQEVIVPPSGTVTADFALEPEATPNRAPVLDAIGDRSVDEGQRLEFYLSATDPDGDLLSYSASGLPGGALLADGHFSWTPGYEEAGVYDVTFRVSDGELTDSETITITVDNVVRHGAIAGTVYDASTGEPIDSATVSAGELEATTGTDGSFVLAQVPEGDCTVAATAEGYSSTDASVCVAAGSTVSVDLGLEPLQRPGNTMWSEDIAFSQTSRSLDILVTIVSPDAVPGAYVFLDLTDSSGYTRHLYTMTDSSGEAEFEARYPSAGEYIAEVVSIRHSEYTWDSSRGVVSKSFTVR